VAEFGKHLQKHFLHSFIFALTVSLAASLNAQAEPLEITNISVSPLNISAGESITVKVSIEKEKREDEILMVYLSHKPPGVDYGEPEFLTFNEASGLYEIELSVNEFCQTGILNISGFMVVYAQRRWGRWGIGQLREYNISDSDLDYDSQVHVTAITETPDTEKPVIKNVQISSNSAKIGDIITITADIKDALSGIKRASISYRLPDSYYGSIPVNETTEMYLNPDTGLYEGYVIVGRRAGRLAQRWDSRIYALFNSDNRIMIHYIAALDQLNQRTLSSHYKNDFDGEIQITE
jgi:hypothetical protein